MGDGFFSHEFTPLDGYGDSPEPTLHRVHTGVRGGLDTFSCAGCHSLGGPDGAGSPTQNAMLEGDGEHASTTNVRNPPAVLGLGFVQNLAQEMSAELQLQRTQALQQAKTTGKAITLALQTKTVSFGSIVVYPDAQIDYAKLEGIDVDLTVRPFGWKGNIARLRRFAEDAARIHFGIQSHILALGYQTKPDPDHLGPGPNWYDPDNDGKVHELEEGVLTAAACYMAMLETPVMLPPYDAALRERWANGSILFDTVGCNDCHKRELVMLSPYFREKADTTSGEFVLNLLKDGEQPRGTNPIKLFSDLKRHDMGPELADPHDNADKIPRSVFLTRPLWGLAESAPYLHDGRAATIPAAILAHGGEAKTARDAFAALSPDEQADVHIFLLSLTRAPRPRVAR